jgi:hypothetical protein
MKRTIETTSVMKEAQSDEMGISVGMNDRVILHCHPIIKGTKLGELKQGTIKNRTF